MATTANLSSILRFYAEKQKSPFIDFHEFCAYLKKYAEHHVEEQADLVKYLGDPSGTVDAELSGLSEKHLLSVITVQKKRLIVVYSFYSVQYSNRFKEILANETIPYPAITDLPKQFPVNDLEKRTASEYIKNALVKQDLKSPLLYSVSFNAEVPDMVLPACIPVKVIIETAHNKIRRILKKEEFHDYFLKKLRSTNPGKEVIIQHFFADFVENKPHAEGTEQMSQGDDFFYWGQLCYHIKQDFAKIQDKTSEDVNILQAIEFSESYNSYLKNKMMEEQKKADALKALRANLKNSPYFFSMDQVLKFKDENGKLLYGIYSNDELKDFLVHSTTDSVDGKLPELLVFKVASGTRYYVYKSNILTLTVRLCNEAHNFIERKLEDRWYQVLTGYDKLAEMSDGQAFEKALEKEVAEGSPVLYALLNSAFMKVIPYDVLEGTDMGGINIFEGNDLKPYSEMLMLNRHQILSNAKMRLPFWYTMPLISWICALFAGNGKKKKDKAAKGKKTTDTKIMSIDDALNLEDEKRDSKKENPKSKKEALAAQGKKLMGDFVPEGSTLDRELDFYCKQWNRMLSKEAYAQLTEDVNCLIRDYMRKVINTLSAQTFTADRIKSLSHTLLNIPSVSKIKDRDSLLHYVQLYILKLVTIK